MATNRIVALTLKLNNLSTLDEMEKTLKEVNAELKNTSIGSENFKKLEQAAVQLSGKIAGVKENLKGISDSKAEEKKQKELEKVNALYIKQADSVAKTGAGIAGALSIATVASQAFGDKSSEEIQKAIQTAQQLSVVLQSIKPISEAINGENVKLFKGFIDGFKKSALGAKLFGNTTKTAIASTGIGLLVVLLATLVANWDSVTSAVGKFIEKIPFLNGITKVIDTIRERVGSLGNLFSALGASITALLKFENPLTAFNEALANGITVENLNNQLEAIDKNSSSLANQIKILEALGNKQTEVFALKKKAYEDEIKILQDLKKSDEDFSQEQQKRLDDAVVNLELLLISERKYYQEKQDLRNQELIKIHEHEIEKLKAQDEGRIEANAIQEKITQDLVNAVQNRIKEIENAQNSIDNAGLITFEEIEEEKVEIVKLSALREQAIRANLSQIEKNRLGDLRDEQIKYYEELGELTEEQEEVLTQLRLEKLSEFVAQASEILTNVVGNISEVLTNSINNNIESINEQIEAVDQKYQSSIQERETLESQLSTADGTRKEAILAGIEEERAKQKQLEQEKKNLTNARIKQENKQRDIQYANAVLQSVMQTAQAILAALTTVPPASFAFAAITAVLAGIQTGIVTSQKPKAIPLMADKGGKFNGGYTGPGGTRDKTGERKGPLLQLHENEWAYVAPRWQVEHPVYSQMIAQLESARQNKTFMAEGGISNSTIPTIGLSNISDNPTQLIADAVARMRPVVSVEEITDVSNRVEVLSSKASL